MVADFDAVTSHNAAGEDADGQDDTIFVGERMEKYPSFPPEKKLIMLVVRVCFLCPLHHSPLRLTVYWKSEYLSLSLITSID